MIIYDVGNGGDYGSYASDGLGLDSVNCLGLDVVDGFGYHPIDCLVDELGFDALHYLCSNVVDRLSLDAVDCLSLDVVDCLRLENVAQHCFYRFYCFRR